MMPSIIALGLIVCGLRIWLGPMNRRKSRTEFKSRLPRKHVVEKFSAEQLVLFLSQLQQELLAGIPMRIALESAINAQSGSAHSLLWQTLIEDDPSALARWPPAEQQWRKDLSRLTKILEVSRQTGASINDALGQMIQNTLAKQEREHLVLAEVSGTKATVFVLALLPVLGLLLGLIIGVNPLYWLLTKPIGWLCLIGGASCEALGIFWVKRLIGSVL
jgi:Flp pilus assembly protein TadB